jgi:hypothetical protein
MNFVGCSNRPNFFSRGLSFPVSHFSVRHSVKTSSYPLKMTSFFSEEESNALLAATDPDAFRGSLSIHKLIASSADRRPLLRATTSIFLWRLQSRLSLHRKGAKYVVMKYFLSRF